MTGVRDRQKTGEYAEIFCKVRQELRHWMRASQLQPPVVVFTPRLPFSRAPFSLCSRRFHHAQLGMVLLLVRGVRACVCRVIQACASRRDVLGQRFHDVYAKRQLSCWPLVSPSISLAPDRDTVSSSRVTQPISRQMNTTNRILLVRST